MVKSTSVSHSFYIDHFSDLPIHPIKELLRIECADGQELPYEGFIEVDLTILGSRGTYGSFLSIYPEMTTSEFG
jgi:hypothetical protein